MVEIIAPDRIMKCDFVCFFLASASLSFHPVFSNEFGIIITLFWASPVAQTVKNPPANAGDTRDVCSLLGQDDPLEEVTATHSSILCFCVCFSVQYSCLENPMDEGPGGRLST